MISVSNNEVKQLSLTSTTVGNCSIFLVHDGQLFLLLMLLLLSLFMTACFGLGAGHLSVT